MVFFDWHDWSSRFLYWTFFCISNFTFQHEFRSDVITKCTCFQLLCRRSDVIHRYLNGRDNHVCNNKLELKSFSCWFEFKNYTFRLNKPEINSQITSVHMEVHSNVIYCLLVGYSFISASQNFVFGCLGRNNKLAQK